MKRFPLILTPLFLLASVAYASEVVQVVKDCKPAVIAILDSKGKVNGTGVIVDARGYAVTCHHVVEGHTEVPIKLASGQVVKAHVVCSAPGKDLALLLVSWNKPLPAVKLGNMPEVGSSVVAIGHPYGLEHSVTTGVVSGLNRQITINGELFTGLIQTDAAINPGNSGGPLLNLKGELIGINCAMRYANSIGYAVPVCQVQEVFGKYLK